MYKVAVVNSKTFLVRFPDLYKKLSDFTSIERLEFPRDIPPEDLARRLQGYQFVVASVTPLYDRKFFELNEDVVMICRHGIGVDNVDVEAATENGVLVTRVPGYKEREAVAEHAVALMLAVVRHLCQASGAVRKGRWGDRGKFVGFELRGRSVGIVGLGNIGSRVAEILSRGFGANVLAYDPYVDGETAGRFGAKLVSLDELLSSSDIISLHVPLTKETRHMLDKDALSKVKEGIIIINTARGELVDTDALIEAIRAGRIGGVGLDVVEGEPIGADHPLLKFDNVLVVPHIGSNTVEGIRGMDESCVAAILDVIRRKAPEGLVNPEVLERENRAGIRG